LVETIDELAMGKAILEGAVQKFIDYVDKTYGKPKRIKGGKVIDEAFEKVVREKADEIIAAETQQQLTSQKAFAEVLKKASKEEAARILYYNLSEITRALAFTTLGSAGAMLWDSRNLPSVLMPTAVPAGTPSFLPWSSPVIPSSTITLPRTTPITTAIATTKPVTTPVTKPVTKPVTTPVTKPTPTITTPVIKPVTKPVTKPVPSKPALIPLPKTSKARERKEYQGAIAWAQGKLTRKGGELVTQYKVWKHPYRQEDLEHFEEDKLPVGVKIVSGISSAYKTVQQFRGEVAPRETQQADIGAFIATVSKPTPKPGGAGEIKFVRDIRGTSDEALRKIALGTTVKQLLKEIYPAKVPKATADRMLSDKLSKMNTSQIVDEISRADVSRARRREVLRMLPDRERSQVELLMNNPVLKAPTRGVPKATFQPKHLRRKKAKTRKPYSPSPPSIMTARP